MNVIEVNFAGYPCLELSHARGSAIVSLHGGQLLSWVPVGQRDVLWLSPQALPAPAAIRGGVPVCWPWFGKQGMPPGAMQHGPVRNVMWQNVACDVTDAGLAVLSLEPVYDEATLQIYAKDLRLRLELELGETLIMRLITHNHGTKPFALTQALHTYFAVGDVQMAELRGVEGLQYASRIDGTQNNLQSDPFHLNALCDNTYALTTATDSHQYQLLDHAWKRAITINTWGSSSLVVWNPGAEGAKNMADVPDAGWADFLCVEAANAGHDTVVLAPGAQHVLQQTLRCTSLDSQISRRRWLAGASTLGALGLSACAVPVIERADANMAAEPALPNGASQASPPSAPREFRAAWVATVANIDWPSRKGLSTVAQQTEMRQILDTATSLKLNAIILQVRPCADALYASDLEPWSEYLSGVLGEAPKPWYDPLALWISEAHARGLELHAWFNPFRARQGEGKRTSPLHVSQSRPQWVKTYGNQLWMDPGEPAAADHSLAVIVDVLRRYDVDGIHLDDYFYPYPVPQGDDAKVELDFPDQASWQRYVEGGGVRTRDDWRRSNVDSLVQRLEQEIHKIKPWVRFGISPFGIGRPELRPMGIQGFSQYHKLYADVERWLQSGWVDYLVPQLYWPIDQKEQAFMPLLDYWHRQNTQGRHVWAGLFTSRVLAAGATPPAKPSWSPDEITRQIAATRLRAPGSGHVHFSMVALLQNRQGLTDTLRSASYGDAALVPASPWLEGDAPLIPSVVPMAAVGMANLFRINMSLPASSRPAVRWAIWLRYGTQWVFRVSVVPEFTVSTQLEPLAGSETDGQLLAITVSAIGCTGQESPRLQINLNEIGLWPRY